LKGKTTMGTKQVIVIRKDLKLRRGKEIAHGAHASQMWLTERLTPVYDAAVPRYAGIHLRAAEQEWLATGTRKVTCQIGSQDEMLKLAEAAESAGLTVYLTRDAGHTEVPENTLIAMAIGPDYEGLIDPLTGSLDLY
jgi:peptidyl-tRNA hydrolase, PTH2 family